MELGMWASTYLGQDAHKRNCWTQEHEQSLLGGPSKVLSSPPGREGGLVPTRPAQAVSVPLVWANRQNKRLYC